VTGVRAEDPRLVALPIGRHIVWANSYSATKI
jgi:hypothetical protein